MAAGPLGINLTANIDYVDLMKQARQFTPLVGSTLPLDSRGWPQADAEIIVVDDRVNQSFNGPDPKATPIDIGGTYHLSFTGRATLPPVFPNNYTVQNQVYNAKTNTTTADLVVTHNSLQLIYIDFKNTYNPASATRAGVSNVKLLQPGYAAGSTQLFSDDMLNALKPFTTIRYLNLDAANNFSPVYDANKKLVPLEWSRRRLPDAASQTSGPGANGQAWEYMVALANATNTDLWINIPGPASDDYVTQLAKLIKNGDTINGVTYAGLNPNLKVDLEFSNEVWGGIYSPTLYNQVAATQRVQAGGSDLDNDGSTDTQVWSQRYYMERTMEVTNLFRGVFGADSNYEKIRPILGWQEGNDQYYTNTFPWFEETHGAPRDFFYGMGNANYGSPNDLSSVNAYISSLYARLSGQYATTSRFTTIATYYGLQNVAYEGGPASTQKTAAQGQVALAANRDPRLEAYTAQLYTTWYSAGGTLAAIYNGPFGIHSPQYQFSLVEKSDKSNPLNSPKYRGIVDVAQASPQAVTAGNQVSASGVTSLPLISDSLGKGFLSPTTGQSHKWLLNVAQAGVYTLTLQTPTTFSGTGRVSVSTSDLASSGNFSFGGGTSSALTNLSLNAGLTTLEITTLSPFTTLNLTLTPKGGPVSTVSGLTDTGFETARLAAGAYFYDAQGSPWNFSGQAGLTTNGTVFTKANPNAPEGRQVAFLQNQGGISQTFNINAAGTYHLLYSVAQRANFGTQSIQILIDDQLIDAFTTTKAAYQNKVTSAFVLTPGSHVLSFEGVNQKGEATAFFDNVKLVLNSSTSTGTPPVVISTTFADASFETNPAGSGFYGFVYAPTGSAWDFEGRAGVTANQSAFTQFLPGAPRGVQVAFLQNQGSISQTITNLAAGTYHIDFAMAQRINHTNTPETFQVLVDKQVVGTYTTSGKIYQSKSSGSITLGSGTHVFTFQGLTSSGDSTALLDNIRLVLDSSTGTETPPVANTASFADASFETNPAGSGFYGFVYVPTGSAWDFEGRAGVTANKTAFTQDNPSAPRGVQVAFLQNQGSISQTITNLAAGTYHIDFAMAQRTNYTNTPETFQVLVDDQVVGTYTTSGATYQSKSSGSITLDSGTHVFTFQGLTSSGDSTALLDNIKLVAEATPNPGAPGSVDISSIADAGFESKSAGSGFYGFVYAPQGSAWTYTGQSGVSANKTAFTAGNPYAPEGKQVGFVQNQGSLAQVVNVRSAGNYRLSFMAAQRANFSNESERIQVLVDGKLVTTYQITSHAYKRLTTPVFALGTGSHVISFKGVTSVGDATAFLDAISLDQV